VISQAQKQHGLEHVSDHRESQSLTHGGGWEGKSDPTAYSQENAQSTSGMDCERSRVQETDSRNLNAGYLGNLHNLRLKEGLAKTERMTDHS
jgi:hypothetical protein